jgi:MFS transporter, DHA2 family, multidrug resistance protein
VTTRKCQNYPARQNHNGVALGGERGVAQPEFWARQGTALCSTLVYVHFLDRYAPIMIPMSLTVALSTLPKSKQPLGLALFGIAATLGPAIGPTVGGWLTDNYGWQWVFYINLIPGALMIGSIAFAVGSAPMQLYQLREGDWLGIGCMAIGLGSLIAMLEEGQRDDWLGSVFIQRCALLAAIFIPAFVMIELSRKKPFVNLRLLARRNLGDRMSISGGTGFWLGRCRTDPSNPHLPS